MPNHSPFRLSRLLDNTALLSLVAILVFLQYQSEFLIGIDGYFHAKIAYLYSTKGLLNQLPWASISQWSDHYVDKELFFHLLIIPFVKGLGLELGSKVAASFFGVLFLTSFYLVLRLNQVKNASFWVTLLFLSPEFLFRILLLRPHVLAITLVVWFIHFCINEKYHWAGVMSFLFGLSYTAFHLPLCLFFLLFFYSYFFSKLRMALKSVVPIILGTLGAIVLHPEFPQNVEIFYIQNFIVPFANVAGNEAFKQAREMSPYTTKEILLGGFSFICALALMIAHAIEKQRPLSAKIKSLLVLSVFFAILTALSGRFIEYAAPFSLFTVALYFSRSTVTEILSPYPKASGTALLGVTILILGLSVETLTEKVKTSESNRSNDKKLAQFLNTHTSPNEIIHTCSWSSASPLFFYNHRNRYQLFLDPVFSYYFKPQKWEAWVSVKNQLHDSRTALLLSHNLKTNTGVCQNLPIFRKQVEQNPHLEIVFSDTKFFIFTSNLMKQNTRMQVGR